MNYFVKIGKCVALPAILSALFLSGCSADQTEEESGEPAIWTDVTFEKTFYLDGNTDNQRLSFKSDGKFTFDEFDYSEFADEAFGELSGDTEEIAAYLQNDYSYMYHNGDKYISFNLFEGHYDEEELSYVIMMDYDCDKETLTFADKTYIMK